MSHTFNNETVTYRYPDQNDTESLEKLISNNISHIIIYWPSLEELCKDFFTQFISVIRDNRSIVELDIRIGDKDKLLLVTILEALTVSNCNMIKIVKLLGFAFTNDNNEFNDKFTASLNKLAQKSNFLGYIVNPKSSCFTDKICNSISTIKIAPEQSETFFFKCYEDGLKVTNEENIIEVPSKFIRYDSYNINEKNSIYSVTKSNLDYLMYIMQEFNINKKQSTQEDIYQFSAFNLSRVEFVLISNITYLKMSKMELMQFTDKILKMKSEASENDKNNLISSLKYIADNNDEFLQYLSHFKEENLFEIYGICKNQIRIRDTSDVSNKIEYIDEKNALANFPSVILNKIFDYVPIPNTLSENTKITGQDSPLTVEQ